MTNDKKPQQRAAVPERVDPYRLSAAEIVDLRAHKREVIERVLASLGPKNSEPNAK